nr:MAG TPA: Integrase [Caudoviricetes sp.]
MAVRTRKRGKTWSYSFDIEPGPDGKRRMKEKGGFSSKEEAFTAGAAAYTDWKNGNIGLTSDKITLTQYLGNWLEKYKPNLKPTSQTVYNYHVKTLSKYLGNIILQELKPRDVDNFLQKLCNAGMSKKTIIGCKNVLHLALKHAIYPLELINTNPTEAVDIPRRATKRVVKRQVISQDKLKEILNYYPFNSDYHIPIVIAYYTGLRIGEILGLEWDCINFNTRELTVKQQLHATASVGCYISSPKTETSNRIILLDTRTLKTLKHWRQMQKEAELNLGQSYVYNFKQADTGKVFAVSKYLATECKGSKQLHLVCTRTNGTYIIPTTIIAAVRRRGINFHSFRHTHATQLIENMASPKSVAARLGHKNTRITEDLYTHVTREMQKQTADIVDKIHQKSVDK